MLDRLARESTAELELLVGGRRNHTAVEPAQAVAGLVEAVAPPRGTIDLLRSRSVTAGYNDGLMIPLADSLIQAAACGAPDEEVSSWRGFVVRMVHSSMKPTKCSLSEWATELGETFETVRRKVRIVAASLDLLQRGSAHDYALAVRQRGYDSEIVAFVEAPRYDESTFWLTGKMLHKFAVGRDDTVLADILNAMPFKDREQLTTMMSVKGVAPLKLFQTQNRYGSVIKVFGYPHRIRHWDLGFASQPYWEGRRCILFSPRGEPRSAPQTRPLKR